MRRLWLLVASATALGLPGGAFVSGAGAQQARLGDLSLTVTFQANHTITVTLPDGTPVGTTSGAPSVIPAGAYTLHLENPYEVSGPSFDIVGPGVNVVDDMFFGESPSSTHAVIFQPSSSYIWRDDETPNVVFAFNTSATISGTATSETGSSTSIPSSSSTSKPVVGSAIKPTTFRGTLVATVTSTGRLALTKTGKSVTTLSAGRYTFDVQDESTKAGFIVQALRKQAVTLTGASFVGKHAVPVTLNAVQWLFFSAGGKKNYFVVIS